MTPLVSAAMVMIDLAFRGEGLGIGPALRQKTPLIFIASCGTIGSAPHHCHCQVDLPGRAFRLTIPNSST